MKSTKEVLGIIFLSLSVFLMGSCSASSDVAPSPTVLPTNMVKPISTATMQPTATPTQTPSPSPTAIMTPPPTLEEVQADEEIKTLLLESSECQSPCVWGIMLKQTTLSEAQSIFLRLRHPLSHMGEEGGKEIYSNTVGVEDGLTFGFQLAVQDKYVQNIKLGIDLGNYKGEVLPRPWIAFSPETLLAQYGVPSKVEFGVSYPTENGFPADIAWYGMVMFFEEINLIVEYDHGITKEGEFIRACPIKDSFSWVGVFLGEDISHPPGGNATLAEATSLTLEEFYDLMIRNPEDACFDLKASAFYP